MPPARCHLLTLEERLREGRSAGLKDLASTGAEDHAGVAERCVGTSEATVSPDRRAARRVARAATQRLVRERRGDAGNEVTIGGAPELRLVVCCSILGFCCARRPLPPIAPEEVGPAWPPGHVGHGGAGQRPLSAPSRADRPPDGTLVGPRAARGPMIHTSSPSPRFFHLPSPDTFEPSAWHGSAGLADSWMWSRRGCRNPSSKDLSSSLWHGLPGKHLRPSRRELPPHPGKTGQRTNRRDT